MKKDNKKVYDDFVKTLEGKTLEELEAIEQKVIKEADDTEEKLSKLTLKLPKENREAAFENIRYFLDKGEYAWQYCLGAKNQYDAWLTPDKTDDVPYATLDATLRTLGEFKFKGYDEWKRVIEINEFFAPIREDYIAATDSIYLIAEKHSAILSKMDLLKPVTGDPNAAQPVKE